MLPLPPAIKNPKSKKHTRDPDKPTMSPADVIQFRKHFKLERTHDLAKLLGVTMQAVEHWEHGRREVPETTVRLLMLFYRRPELTREF